jgi:hypothetical protein
LVQRQALGRRQFLRGNHDAEISARIGDFRSARLAAGKSDTLGCRYGCAGSELACRASGGPVAQDSRDVEPSAAVVKEGASGVSQKLAVALPPIVKSSVPP